MCFSSPKAPADPIAPPPPAPLKPPVIGKPQETLDQLAKKKLGYARLQIPLTDAPAPAAASGLSIPK